MSLIQTSITQKLTQQLNVTHLDVLNESHMHAVPPNSETHFKVVAVSPLFEELRSVKRHQMVYAILAEELSSEVHALSLSLFTPDEWQKNTKVFDSPACMGKRILE